MRQSGAQRRLIFVSHAVNSQDNYATLWMCTRLAAAGYEVWSDLTRLVGGELFWNDIQDVIRNYAAKVVFLASRAAVTRDGFLNEVSLAAGTERAAGLADFLIPCRLDDLPHNDLPAQLHRRNTIDFSEGWHLGFGRLLTKFEKDGVPRKQGGRHDDLSAWSKEFLGVERGLSRTTEKLYSSWVPLGDLPASIRIHRRNPGHSSVRQNWSWPVVPFDSQLLLTFAAAHELSDAPASQPVVLERDVSLDLFQEGGHTSLIPKLSKRDISNILVDLMQQAWDRYCEQRGLLPFELAGGRKCWYLPLPSNGVERHQFVDMLGKTRKKALIGRSDKYEVYWHLAVQANVVLGTTPRLGMNLHVIFTSDGKTPLASAKRMHRLRRAFCKNWWQWQWRDLLLVFLAWCARQESTFGLPVGGSRAVQVAARPMTFEAPVTSPEGVQLAAGLDEPVEADDLAVDWLEGEGNPLAKKEGSEDGEASDA
jgi:TIR domain-containing protein